MISETVNIAKRECRLYQQAEAEFLLIQPVDEHDSMLLEQEVRIVAASPSVWYPDWIDYTGSHKPFSASVYLSLGDKEEIRTVVMLTR